MVIGPSCHGPKLEEVLLRANAGRPEGLRASGGRNKRPVSRSSSNSHLHIALAIAIAASSLIAIVIPITRTHANRASPGTADGVSEALRLQAASVSGILASAEADGGGAARSIQPPLGSGLFPEPLLAAAARLAAGSVFPSSETAAALALTRQRAVSFTVHEDGFGATYSTTDVTVGQALASQGVRLAEGDFVSPPPDSALVAGAHIYISHSLPVRLVIAGTEQAIRTRAKSVEEVLVEAGVTVESTDRVSPARGAAVRPEMVIRVTTVRDVKHVVEEPIEYASEIQYDAGMARGQRVITQAGTAGYVRREYQVRQINGRDARRKLVSETVTLPTDEVVTVGTYVKPAAPVVAAAVSTPEGCTRTLNVYATWYTAASSGGSGVTATGTGVYKGIVAVDPRVIPLGTRMYIPGYGYGIAADTGGGIIGNMIDLGYGADDVKDWRTRWVDICIL